MRLVLIGFSAALTLGWFFMGLTLGCAAARSYEAEAGYLGQQLQCVDKAETRSEADLCREQVKARWASKDAGSEQ